MNPVYMYHHRQWWCHRQMFIRLKRIYTILNILSLLITSLGLIIGPVLQNVLLTSILAAIGMFIKGWKDFKRYSIKMDMSKFAYSTHAKALTEFFIYFYFILFATLITKNIGKEEEEEKKRSGEET